MSTKRLIITIDADSDSRGLYNLKTHLEDVLRKLSQNRYNLNNVRAYVSQPTRVEGLVLDLASALEEQARNLAENAADTAVEDHDTNRHWSL